MTELNKTYIRVSNVNLYCEYELSNKPFIFLIHGFVSSTYTFRKVIPYLQERFSIIAIDLPGFGRSEKSTTFIYSFENYAKLMIACLKKFNIEEAYVMAHSMGGQIALHMARMAPEKIKKLILLCSSGYLKRAKRATIYISYIPFFDRVAYYYIHRKAVREYLKNVFFNKSLINDQLIEEFSLPLAERGFYKSLIRLLRHREGDLLPEQLQEIKISTLLIWGEEDSVVPIHVGRRLVKDLPDAKLITYKKTGHLITEERPEKIFQHILMHINLENVPK